MPATFENGRKFDGKKIAVQKMYLNPKNRPFSFQKRRKMFCFRYFECLSDAISKMCRQELRVQNVPFSKSAGKKMCRFRVNGKPIHYIFHRFQNVPASCERSLKQQKSFLGLQRKRY